MTDLLDSFRTNQVSGARGRAELGDGLLNLIAILFVVGSGASQAFGQDGPSFPLRTWTQNDGQQVNARFIAKVGNQVKMERFDGTVGSIVFDSLSEADQTYVDDTTATHGEMPAIRQWTDTNGNSFRGRFAALNRSEVEFLLVDENRRLTVEATFLIEGDLEHIVDQINRNSFRPGSTGLRYRTWGYADANGNALKSVARFKSLTGESVVLGQYDAEFRVPARRFSLADIDYLISSDPINRSTYGKFDGQSKTRSSKTGKETDEEEKERKYEVTPIYYVSFGIIVLLLVVLISARHIYDSSQREPDDD